MREVAHAERGVQNVQVVQTSSENTFKLSPSASLPESDQYHHPRIPENDCRMCNFLQQKMRKDQVDFLVFSSFAIASLPVVHIQVEKTQRPCVWTPTLWSTPHLCTNLSLARSRLAFSSQWNVLEWFVELRTWVIKHTKLVCIDVIWFAKKSLKIKASCHADCIGKMQKWRNTMMGWQKLNKYAKVRLVGVWSWIKVGRDWMRRLRVAAGCSPLPSSS